MVTKRQYDEDDEDTRELKRPHTLESALRGGLAVEEFVGALLNSIRKVLGVLGGHFPSLSGRFCFQYTVVGREGPAILLVLVLLPFWSISVIMQRSKLMVETEFGQLHYWAGHVDKAREWFQAMLNAGLRPNVPTCNSLLSAFLRMQRLADAYDLLQSMLRLGLHPTLQTYTLLLSCSTDATFHIDMGFCWKLMAVTGHPAHAFLVSMPSSGLDGGLNVRKHASSFLDLMHSEDRESKRGLVDAVIYFLH